jgi:N-acetylglucosamine-6-phosphate deacetylase
MTTQVLQGNLILADRIVEAGQIVVEDAVISAVVEERGQYHPTFDAGGCFIAPGFIDLHVHGVSGVDVMDGSRVSIRHMAERFAAHGVIGFLPTTMTQSVEVTTRAVSEVCEYLRGQAANNAVTAQVLGIHLEGPWLSPRFKGAQDERYILPPDEETIRALLAAAGGTVRKVTLAPEQPGGDRAIALLRAAGIYVSIGHSAATYEQALAAVEQGATHVTHCFNAMAPLNHRQPGVVGAALLVDDLFAELIADGVHIHTDVMRLLIRVKGRERVMLITDAMSATELTDGTYALGGQEVFVRNGEARLRDGTLAGSTLVLDQAIRNLVRRCGVSLADAVYMASTTPATAIGLGSRKGRIQAGYDADLTILDRTLHPSTVMIGGQLRRLDQSPRG